MRKISAFRIFQNRNRGPNSGPQATIVWAVHAIVGLGIDVYVAGFFLEKLLVLKNRENVENAELEASLVRVS